MIPTVEPAAEFARLSARCDELQRAIARSLRDKQDLIGIRNDLDRDLARFRVIGRYSRLAIGAETVERLYEATVESIVEAFELESAAVLTLDCASMTLTPTATFGFQRPVSAAAVHARWGGVAGLFERTDALVLSSGDAPCPELSLAQAIVCPFCGADGVPEGALLGGTGLAKRPFYEPITPKLVPTFTVFTQQMSALLHNLKARNRMRRLNAALEQEIGERRRAQDELRRAHDQLESRVAERTAELTAANQAKSLFLANMSHELRTPMNAVIGFAEMILDGVYGDVPARIRDVVCEIQQSGEHLLGLINDVLDITRIESGHMELRLEEGSLCEPMEAAVSRMEPLAREKGLRLTIDVPGELPLTVFDRKRITQVLTNLVGNAVKFTARGGVEVGATPVADSVHLWVRDTGIGIARKDQASIFGEFTQVDGSLARETQGSGLGLSIARRLVTLHGGRITVESVPGEGSTFTVILPIRRRR